MGDQWDVEGRQDLGVSDWGGGSEERPGASGLRLEAFSLIPGEGQLQKLVWPSRPEVQMTET